MSREMEVFDSAAVELRRGISLIEASAGTGKTYAIAMLVLRLVTEQAIPIDRLLVVTFTKAATSELRERIRKRLAEARDLLRDPTGEADPTLRAWAAGIGGSGLTAA
jgi:exodeoxyribonuclease V beta subunit